MTNCINIDQNILDKYTQQIFFGTAEEACLNRLVKAQEYEEKALELEAEAAKFAQSADIAVEKACQLKQTALEIKETTLVEAQNLYQEAKFNSLEAQRAENHEKQWRFRTIAGRQLIKGDSLNDKALHEYELSISTAEICEQMAIKCINEADDRRQRALLLRKIADELKKELMAG